MCERACSYEFTSCSPWANYQNHLSCISLPFPPASYYHLPHPRPSPVEAPRSLPLHGK